MFKKLVFTSAFAISSLAAQAAELTVDIAGITQLEGDIYVVLYDSVSAMESNKATLANKGAVTKLQTTVTFSDLSAGDYAILAYQDLDNNQKLNRNMIGIPNEPYGFSNNPRLMGPPSFDKLRFAVGDVDHTIQISID